MAANIGPERFAEISDLVLHQGSTAITIDLAAYLRDPDVPGSAARIAVRIGTQIKNIDLALYDEETPITVANFKQYIAAGRYANNFIHRSEPWFIIQGGGFRWGTDGGEDYLDSVPTYPTILNEPGISNTRGTVAMAKIGPPEDEEPTPETINSATSQWFINTGENSSNLDNQNGGFTVFARVVGNGMTVADEVNALPHPNAGGPFTSIPVKDLSGQTIFRVHTIETNTSLIAPLTHIAESEDPDTVLVSLTDAILTLTPASDRSGSTQITLTTTDLDGASLETQFVVTVLETYSAWSEVQPFAFPADANPTADPDHDGISNLLEYALTRNPLQNDADARFSSDASGQFSVRLRFGAALRHIVESSPDLGTWHTVWHSDNPLDDPAIHSLVVDPVAARYGDFIFKDNEYSDAAKLFWRVRVEELEE